MTNKERYLQSKAAAQQAKQSKEWSLKGGGLTITQLYRGDLYKTDNQPKVVNYAAHHNKLHSFEQSFCN
jgi:hypothetical protein